LLDVPAEYGGGGGDFRHEAVMYTELARRGIASFGQGVHSMCSHYVLNHGTDDQKRRFLPRLAAGELIGAICMTEPGTGSDLKGIRTRAVKQGDHYVVDGGKTFITNGFLAGSRCWWCAPMPDRSKGCRSSWSRRRICRAIASAAVARQDGSCTGQDTSELFLKGREVPSRNCGRRRKVMACTSSCTTLAVLSDR
jgi:acyl-CoA dehydrogenase